MMDTTRRQLLAAIPAVGVAVTTGYGQEAQPAKRESWEYTTLGFALSDLDRPEVGLLSGRFGHLGLRGYSVASLLPSGAHATAIVKRSVNNRMAWEFKSFIIGKYFLVDSKAIGAEGWEIFYVTPAPIEPTDRVRIAHAQRPLKGVEVDDR